MDTLEERVEKIEERNVRVQADKAWEGSLTRKVLVALFTYIVISIFFSIIGVERPFINAIVPTLGFLLSTLTMPFFKEMWLKCFLNQKYGRE
ncbi:MAG: hypothetical protein WCG73_01645 [Candidatus Moraniibacteriota bacterium]